MNAQFKAPSTIEQHSITGRDQWLALRKLDVTASAAGALLGVHEYVTAYGLWATKSGKVSDEQDETAAMKRGRLLEPVAKALIAEQYPGWVLASPDAYFRDPVARLGATPDLFAHNSAGELGIIQIKTVAPFIFKKKWYDDDGELDVPLWIAVQAAIEAHLTGATWASVAVMVVDHGIDLHMVDVPFRPGVIDMVKAKVAEFWTMIENDQTPQPDFARDSDTIAALYPESNGATIDLTGNNHIPELLAKDEALAEAAKSAAEGRKAIKAEIMAVMGSAEIAILPGWKLTCKTTHKKAFSVAATSFRQVRHSRV